MSLGRSISHRLLHTIVSLYVAATVIFFMAHAIPGSVARLELGDSPFTGAALKSIEASLGLNTSIWQQMRDIYRARVTRQFRHLFLHRPTGDDDDQNGCAVDCPACCGRPVHRRHHRPTGRRHC